MRRAVKFLAMAAVAGLVGSGVYAADVLSQIGVPQERAESAVGSILSYGLMNPGLPSTAFKAMPPSTRASVATAGIAWLRTYTASANFQKMYATLRENNKPSPPSYKLTPEEQVEADAPKPASDEDVKKMEAMLSPEQRKQFEEKMKQIAEQLAKMNTPENRKLQLDAIKAQRAQEQKEYEQSVADWQKKFPIDPKPLIVERLKAFMALSADVDFAAATATADGGITFVKPEYEGKPESWKLCYRAGKEATSAARAGVEGWLKALGA
jgi:hypothetical protein